MAALLEVPEYQFFYRRFFFYRVRDFYLVLYMIVYFFRWSVEGNGGPRGTLARAGLALLDA